MSNQPATFLAFRRSFATVAIDTQNLNDAIIAMKSELYNMKTDKSLLTQELALLKTRLPETKIEDFMNGSIEDFFSKLIEITFTIFSAIETAILTAGATTDQIDFMQAIDMVGKVFLMSIPILAGLIIFQKAISTYLKPITMIFDATFRQPLIYTVSYMLTHQDEMKSMGEDKLLNLLQDSIAKQKE